MTRRDFLIERRANMKIKSCNECHYYRYESCIGYDCSHPDAPEDEDRGEEPLAENREGDFPMWCPLNFKKGEI